jgi:arylsulfatase A-like enzyme
VLDYLGLQPTVELDGRSLRPLIEEGEPIHDQVFAAYGSLRAVVDERFKLIADFATGENRLYDRSADPGETRDVAAEHPEVVVELQQALTRWLRDTERLEDQGEALRRGQEAAERLRALGYIQ